MIQVFDESRQLSAEALALKSPAELAVLQKRLAAGLEIADAAKAKLDQALELKYRPEVDLQLRRARKEAGTVTFDDGQFRVKCELPKEVTFDQGGLDKGARKLADRGEKPEEWLDREWVLGESRYKAWPRWAQQIFRGARLVKLRRFKVTLSRREQAAA